MERIIHNECGCVHTTGVNDENCIKRTYLVADAHLNRFLNISICNEYIRLMLMSEKNRYKKHLYAYRESDISDILCKIFRNYITINDYMSHRFGNTSGSNDISELSVSVIICNRPNIYSYINILDAINICLIGYNNVICKDVKACIKNYLESTPFKKYKTKYKNCFTILNKIEKERNPIEIEILYNSLFLLILELNIKNK